MSSDKLVTKTRPNTSASLIAPTTNTSAPAPAAARTQGYRLPHENTLTNIVKLAIAEDKPIMFDYWTDSLEKKALIGVRENGEKLLVKSAEEYTSPISKFYRAGTEFIVITENSIYVVANDIPTRKIS
jgi:hypothetical protein